MAYTIDQRDLKDMITGYRVAVMELLEDEDPETGETYDTSRADFDKSALDYINDTCRKFAGLIANCSELKNMEEYDWNQVGIDLYLTQNGHGTGFWDRPDIYGGDCDVLDKLVEKNFSENYASYDPETDSVFID